ncbi:MAG: InlB B-repeat-containing protein [Kiritimatiellae bacterium]|nr:InlB B-repeat-containing protein [Kiritimatiellia bacterium]
MKTKTFRNIFAAMIAVAGVVVAHASNFTVTSSTSGSSTKFIVTRDDATAAETVRYRTVSLSAYAGQHFTSASGTLAFAPGQTSTNVVVTETTPTAAAYRFQTGNSREYRIELTDAGGFFVTNATRTLTTGTSVPSSGAFNVRDVTIQSAEYTADDDGYDSNGYKSAASSAYFSYVAPKAYYALVDAQLRMTLSMSAKENDDGYQYLQLLVDETVDCDNRKNCSDGDPGNISLSRYMAGFEILSGSKDAEYKTYTFPVTNVVNNAGAANPWGYGNGYPLDHQKFNSGCRATDGRLVLPLDFSSIVLRLNASGKSGSDEWAAKNVTAKIQAVDATAPTKLDVSVAPGIHAKGNVIYVSVAFSEPVTGSPSLSTSWGTLNYFSGSGSNVLTFKGTIPADATDTLNVTGKIGTISDLAGKEFTGSVSANNLANLDASHAYAITYDLAGGALPEGASNPTTYTYETPSFTLAPPVRPGYNFAGWTEGSGSTPNPSVAIYRFHGDRAYVANWTPITYSVHFDPGAADATGLMPDQSFTYDAPQALSSNAFTRAGYAFAGWRGADGAIHPDRATVLNLTNAQDAVVSLTATWRPNIPYIDEDGTERICTDYTVLTNATGDVTYGANGEESWYVVTNSVTISGQLCFYYTIPHLILCDGATLAVTNANGNAIHAGDLAIYGQTNGTGTVTANGTNGAGISAADFSVTINGGTVTAIGSTGIYAHYAVTINGGTVTANGDEYGDGIFASSKIILGWTNPTDSITASSYYTIYDGVSVKSDQRLTDGSNIYKDTDDLGTSPSGLAGVTLVPAYSITLPEGVVASGVVTQDGTTAYALPGTNVTLSAATPGYAIGDVTVNGVPLADGTCSFAASDAAVTITVTMTPVTYVVRFDAGGGEGSMPDQSFTYGAPQALTSNAFTRAGYTFAGWLGADGAIYPDGADVDRLYVRYIVRYADNKEDTWKRFDRMPYPGKTNDDYHLGDGALQNTENDNGLNLYTGFENSDWDPDDPYTAAIISQNAAWFDEHDARNGVSMKLIEDFPNFYKEPVVVAQDGVVTLVAQWGIPYIDADGAERTCTDYTVITNATGDATYGEWGEESWYVVTNAVTIGGWLIFTGTSHLILCDGATLAVTTANDNAIYADDIAIYGQTNGTGTVTANGSSDIGIYVGNGSVTINGGNVTANATGTGSIGISAVSVTINGGTVTATGGGYGIYAGNGFVTINGGNVTANATGTGIYAYSDVTINGGTVASNAEVGNYGIYALNGSITLGWTNPADSITASSYYANYGEVSVKSNQRLTDGSAIYKDTDDLGNEPSAIAGVTLRPYIDTPAYPAYLGLPADPADDTEGDAVIRANYDAWAQRYGYDALGANETAYLLDVAPSAVADGVAPLKVVEMGVTNILVSEAGDFGWVAKKMGYTGDTLPFWRLVMASDVAPLKEGFYDALTVCNGYLVLRFGTDLSAPKSEWLELGWFAQVEDGRAELLCPAFILEKYRERVASETQKPCPGLFLSVTISPRPSDSTAFAAILGEELGDYLQ